MAGRNEKRVRLLKEAARARRQDAGAASEARLSGCNADRLTPLNVFRAVAVDFARGNQQAALSVYSGASVQSQSSAGCRIEDQKPCVSLLIKRGSQGIGRDRPRLNFEHAAVA